MLRPQLTGRFFFRPSLKARRAQTSLLAMGRYFEILLEQNRQTPGDDLTSRLVQAEARGEIQGGAELLAQRAMLRVGRDPGNFRQKIS